MVGGRIDPVLVNAQQSDPVIDRQRRDRAVIGAYNFCYPRARVITLVPLFDLPLVCRNPALIYLDSV